MYDPWVCKIGKNCGQGDAHGVRIGVKIVIWMKKLVKNHLRTHGSARNWGQSQGIPRGHHPKDIFGQQDPVGGSWRAKINDRLSFFEVWDRSPSEIGVPWPPPGSYMKVWYAKLKLEQFCTRDILWVNRPKGHMKPTESKNRLSGQMWSFFKCCGVVLQ